MPAFVFFLFTSAAVVALLVYIFRNNGQGPNRRGWWGGWGTDPDRPSGPPPKDPGPDPDGLLEVPLEWIEAHGKWAKQVVKENLKKIMVSHGAD